MATLLTNLTWIKLTHIKSNYPTIMTIALSSKSSIDNDS